MNNSICCKSFFQCFLLHINPELQISGSYSTQVPSTVLNFVMFILQFILLTSSVLIPKWFFNLTLAMKENSLLPVHRPISVCTTKHLKIFPIPDNLTL